MLTKRQCACACALALMQLAEDIVEHPDAYFGAEDFAESVKDYTLDNDSFRESFPTRSSILDRVFGAT